MDSLQQSSVDSTQVEWYRLPAHDGQEVDRQPKGCGVAPSSRKTFRTSPYSEVSAFFEIRHVTVKRLCIEQTLSTGEI